MRWIGRTTRRRAEQEVKFDNREIVPVIAYINCNNGTQYDFHIHDVNPDGSLDTDEIRLSEWVNTLVWAKRKCREYILPLSASEWTWEKVE